MATKSKTKAKHQTVGEYLGALNDEQRTAVERLRKIIHAAAPDVEEAISYQIIGFRLRGKWLAWIGAAEKHSAIYGVGTAEAALAGYDTSGKGTIRFPLGKPVPVTFVRKLVKARVAKAAKAR